MAGPNPFEGMEENPFAGMEEDSRSAPSILELQRQEAEFAAKPVPGVARGEVVPASGPRPPRITPPQFGAEDQARMLGIRLGELPGGRAAPTFFGDELEGLRQLNPDYEFERIGPSTFPVSPTMAAAGVPGQIASEGPMAGKVVFRKKAGIGGISEPWTTLSQPGAVTLGDVASMAGSIPQTGLALGGTILGGMRFGAPGAVAGAALGGFGGELARQEIGTRAFGASELPTPSRIFEAAKAGASEAAAAQLGNYLDKAARFFMSAGVPIQSIVARDYRQIQKELADIIGEDAAKLMTAGDIIATFESGAPVVAIEKFLRDRGMGDIGQLYLKRAKDKEELLISRLEAITGGKIAATDASSVMQEIDTRLALLGTPENTEITTLKNELAKLQKEVPALRDANAIAQLDDIIKAGGGVPKSEYGSLSDVGQVLSNVVGPTARGEIAAVGKIVHPDIQTGAKGKTAADEAFNRSVEKSREIMDRAKVVGGSTGNAVPESTLETLKKWSSRIEREIIPALNATDRDIVKSALRVLVDEEGNPKRAVSYDDLLQASSNLKASIRNGWTKEWNVNLEMMADLEESITKDLMKRLPKDLAEDLTDANTVYYAQKQAFRQSGLDKFLRRASGGADYLSDSAAASRILGNVETSSALSRILTRPEDKPVRDTIKGNLLWDLDHRFIDGKGNVNQEGLRRWIADNDAILKSWFTPDELKKITDLTTFTERRVALGLKPGDTYDKWFERFWEMPAERAQDAVAAIRRRLPTDEANKLVGQIQGLANARLRRDYVSFDEAGRETFNSAKFFNDMERGRADWVSRAIDPGFGARLRLMTTSLRDEAAKTANQINTLQMDILAATSRLAEDKKAVSVANSLSNIIRGGFRFESGARPTDYARLADKIVSDANPTAAREIVSFLEREAPELLPDFRKSILGAFYRSVTKTSEAARGTTTGGRADAVDVEKLFKFAGDSASMDFMQTILGKGTDAKKAIGDLASTAALLNPRSQSIIVNQAQNPARTALQSLQTAKRVVFGVLSSEARLANSLLNWQTGKLQDRAARALLDPDEFARLVAIGNRTNVGATASTAAAVALMSEAKKDIFAGFEPRRQERLADKAVRAGRNIAGATAETAESVASYGSGAASWLWDYVTRE